METLVKSNVCFLMPDFANLIEELHTLVPIVFYATIL